MYVKEDGSSTSYLPQAYRLSILIDKQTLFINSWLIRLSVDNVLLINTRRLSILMDKSIPLSIGVSTGSYRSLDSRSGHLSPSQTSWSEEGWKTWNNSSIDVSVLTFDVNQKPPNLGVSLLEDCHRQIIIILNRLMEWTSSTFLEIDFDDDRVYMTVLVMRIVLVEVVWCLHSWIGSMCSYRILPVERKQNHQSLTH